MLLIAHRGASARYPENTATAFNAALAAGVDGIELDLRWGADRVVVTHDADLRRFGGSTTPILRRSWADLRTSEIGAWKHRRFCGERLLDLEGLLDQFGGRTLLLLEIKPPRSPAAARRLVHAVLDAVRQRRLEQRVMLLCFELRVLTWAQAYLPTVARVWNRGAPPSHTALRQAQQRAGIHAVDCALDRLDAAAGQRIRDAGLLLAAYSANHAAALAVARRAGVDVLLSDRPEWLVPAAR